jgi:hypothetical protein
MNQKIVGSMKLSPSIWLVILIALFFACSGNKSDTVNHLAATIDYHNKAATISNKGPAWSADSKEDIEKIDAYNKMALEEARLIDFAALNKEYPSLGDHCQQELLRGLELMLEGNQKGDANMSLSGQVLLDRFGEWYHSHFDEIRKARR